MGLDAVIQKFPHKPALAVLDSYYFSTSLKMLNSPLCIGRSAADLPPDPIRTAPVKFIGAVRKDRRAHTEAMEGKQIFLLNVVCS